ncbi:SGNH/GDSL hydrolase family protein [Neolewinella sp.]|uniref:SGNH/GDSL hydrolase family protein n=1 Tax=Neolewinella sp. TaxID=2993543 RepID=UPI003B52D9C0
MPSRTTFLLLVTTLLMTCTTPLRKRNLLIIGDSNGAAREGWVAQLQDIRGGGPLVNTSLGGNTIGFTDDGDMGRNTLENLTPYLRRGYAELGGIDEILIALGTNDCKQKFGDRHDEIITNLETLLSRTQAFFTERGQDMPRIVLLTPPPAGANEMVSDEFQGVKQCTADFSAELRTLAAREGYCLVDLQTKPGDRVLTYSQDGIHFDAEGYRLLARAVVSACY